MEEALNITWDQEVELCRKGDAGAYYKVYQRYARPMLNSSMRILNNLADAEDMVQETFMDAFANLDKYTYKSNFEGWLRRIVINKSISLLRKRKICWTDEDLSNKADDETIVNEEEFSQDIEKIKKAIEQLPDTHRIIFNLFVVDEVPQEEIASMLQLSHNNVRTIYHRARKKVLELAQ